MQAGPNGRSAGSILLGRPAQLLLLARPGEARHWPATSRRGGGICPGRSDACCALFTQILPFYDDGVVALCGEFERDLYAGLGLA
jgi:hypothetical protein